VKRRPVLDVRAFVNSGSAAERAVRSSSVISVRLLGGEEPADRRETRRRAGWRTVEPGEGPFNDPPTSFLGLVLWPRWIADVPGRVDADTTEEAEMPVRTADAEWTGTLQEGTGRMRFGGGAFEGQYSFGSRFEEGEGTNPEELIAAAHAGCYSMALSGSLVKAGFAPEPTSTRASPASRSRGSS
jgi:hypothetical protein